MTMTKNGLEYRATSLEDIAAEFDNMAIRAALGGYGDKDKSYCEGMAVGFEKAAAILRATKLEARGVPPKGRYNCLEHQYVAGVCGYCGDVRK